MKLIDSVLGAFGFKLVRQRNLLDRVRTRHRSRKRAALLAAMSSAPASVESHCRFAEFHYARGNTFLAHAAARSAAMLAPTQAEVGSDLLTRTRLALPALNTIDHNRFHRLDALSRTLCNLGFSAGSSVLDVGGGDGELAAFLPDARYFLADKRSNGVDSATVPKGLGKFDFVVSCHVLEHVPMDERTEFLDALVNRSAVATVLLNPFRRKGDHVESRLRLVLELTGAGWAKEHLDCTLPTLDSIRNYADLRGMSCSIEAVGAITTATAFVFLDYYARQAGAVQDLTRINCHFNELLCSDESSPHAPTGYAVVLTRT